MYYIYVCKFFININYFLIARYSLSTPTLCIKRNKIVRKNKRKEKVIAKSPFVLSSQLFFLLST